MKQVKQLNWTEEQIAESAGIDKAYREAMEQNISMNSDDFRDMMKHMIKSIAFMYQTSNMSELQYHAAMMTPAQLTATYLYEDIDVLIDEINEET